MTEKLDARTHSPRMCRRCTERAINEASGDLRNQKGFWWCRTHQTLGLVNIEHGRVTGWRLYGPMLLSEAAKMMNVSLAGLELQFSKARRH